MLLVLQELAEFVSGRVPTSMQHTYYIMMLTMPRRAATMHCWDAPKYHNTLDYGVTIRHNILSLPVDSRIGLQRGGSVRWYTDPRSKCMNKESTTACSNPFIALLQ